MNRLMYKSVKLVFAIVIGAVLFSACSKDEATNRLQLDEDRLFLTSFGETKTLGFWYENITRVDVTSMPAGWSVKADLATRKITVTAPAELNGLTAVRSGNVVVSGYSSESGMVTARLFVSVVNTKDLNDVRSNSYILSQPYTFYTFDATYKGESAQMIVPADVRVVWQTSEDIVKYAKYQSGKFSFYIDGKDKLMLTPGNAVVGAYDGAGQLLWSWHLWVVNEGIVTEQRYNNGKTFMSLNLGALGNTNKTHDDILASYGMFYQWGRKDPFVGPSAYNAAKGTDRSVYNGEGKRIRLSYVESSAQTGTLDYALANPLSYITGAKDNNYDWLVVSSNGLWADAKTVNDPCPKGWRVPSATDFEGLSVGDVVADAVNSFGWNLTDGTMSSFFPGAGFRTYLKGVVQNVYNPIDGVEVPLPWVGYYWTTGVENNDALSMYFWLDVSKNQSGIDPSTARHRANGMQIRCVKQ